MGLKGLAPYSLMPQSMTTAKHGHEHAAPGHVITVEFVRSRDDEWSLLIDGVQWEPIKDNATGDEIPQPLVYELPSPIVSDTTMTTANSCREVVFAARLESEALAPAKIEIMPELVSDPNLESRRYAKDSPVEIVPYAVEAPTANVVVLPYPFVAPKLPSAAILSFDESTTFNQRIASTLSSIGGEVQDVSVVKSHLLQRIPTAMYRMYKFGDSRKSSTKAISDAVDLIMNVERVVNPDGRAWTDDIFNAIRHQLLSASFTLKTSQAALVLLDYLNFQQTNRPHNNKFMFVPDDAIKLCSSTTLHAQYRVEITENDGLVRAYVFRATKLHGLVAHTVMSKLAVEVEMLSSKLKHLASRIEGTSDNRHWSPWAKNSGTGDATGVKFDFSALTQNINVLEDYHKQKVLVTLDGYPIEEHVLRIDDKDDKDGVFVRLLPQVVKKRAVRVKLTRAGYTTEVEDVWDVSMDALRNKDRHEWKELYDDEIKARQSWVQGGYNMVELKEDAAEVAITAMNGIKVMLALAGVSYLGTLGGVAVAVNAPTLLAYGPIAVLVNAAKTTTDYFKWALTFTEKEKINYKIDQARLAAYDEAKLRLRGSPMDSCYDNAHRALRGVLETQPIVTSTRLRLCHVYTSAQRLNFPPLMVDKEWAMRYDTRIFSIPPPSDVVSRLDEVINLRRCPLSKTIGMVVGTSSSEFPTTPAAIAANAAHSEIIACLSEARTPLRGVHMTETVHGISLDVAIGASELISEACSSQIDGGDDYWWCFPMGVAARLALRQTPVFTQLDTHIRWTGDSLNNGVVSTWSIATQNVAREFAKAWVIEGRRVASLAKRVKLPGVYTSAVPNTDGLFNIIARLLLLADGDTLVREIIGNRDYNVHLLSQVRSISFEHPQRLSTHLNVPSVEWVIERLRTSLASRRADIESIDEWRVNSGIRELRLPPLEDSENRHYYFPMGYTVSELPGSTPFNSARLSGRPIWLQTIKDIQVRYERAHFAKKVDGRGIVIEHAFKPTGLQRHPLIISLHGNYIKMFCPFEQGISGTTKTDSSLQGAANAASSLIFSAERIYNALALSLTKTPRPTSIGLKMTGDPRKIATATLIGLAMLEDCLFGPGHDLSIDPVLILPESDWAKARNAMVLVGKSVQRALDGGCRVVQLSELAISISR